MAKKNDGLSWFSFLILCLVGMTQASASEYPDTDSAPTSGQLAVVDAWVRLTPPVVKSSAAYFILRNMGEKDLNVIGVSSTAAGSVMMHDSIVENGIASMEHLMNVHIPAGTQVEFKPGAKHLMLINLKEKLIKGKTLPVVFKLQSGESISVEMPIR